MFSKQLCICDVEPVYLKRLLTSLNQHSGFSWRIETISHPKYYPKESHMPLLISGRALELGNYLEHPESVTGVFEGRVILLQDDLEAISFEPSIKKYQSSRAVYKALRELLEDEKTKKSQVLLVYGAGGGPAAERYGEELAGQACGEGDVLVVPLTEYPVHSDQFSGGGNLSEWFYYLEQNQERKECDYTYAEGTLDYARGFRTVYDLSDIKLSEWQYFFEKELRQCRYQTIVIVIDKLPVYPEFFDWVDGIYIQWGRDGYGDMRKEAFKKMLEYMDMSHLSEKIVEV